VPAWFKIDSFAGRAPAAPIQSLGQVCASHLTRRLTEVYNTSAYAPEIPIDGAGRHGFIKNTS